MYKMSCLGRNKSISTEGRQNYRIYNKVCVEKMDCEKTKGVVRPSLPPQWICVCHTLRDSCSYGESQQADRAPLSLSTHFLPPSINRHSHLDLSSKSILFLTSNTHLELLFSASLLPISNIILTLRTKTSFSQTHLATRPVSAWIQKILKRKGKSACSQPTILKMYVLNKVRTYMIYEAFYLYLQLSKSNLKTYHYSWKIMLIFWTFLQINFIYVSFKIFWHW